jgi:hypothetical protein
MATKPKAAPAPAPAPSLNVAILAVIDDAIVAARQIQEGVRALKAIVEGHAVPPPALAPVSENVEGPTVLSRPRPRLVRGGAR